MEKPKEEEEEKEEKEEEEVEGQEKEDWLSLDTVSYTHLTLPTRRTV